MDRRRSFRHQLFALGYTHDDGTPAYPPIPEPMLSPEDIVFLMDVFYDDDPCMSLFFRGNEVAECLSRISELALCMPMHTVVTHCGFELYLDDDGVFDIVHEFIRTYVHAIRLKDWNVLRLHSNSKDPIDLDLRDVIHHVYDTSFKQLTETR